MREESGRIVGALTAWIGSLDIAEEAVADAVEEALREWRVRGVPPNPGGWLTQAARHNALDRLRRESRYREKLLLLAEPAVADPSALALAGEGDADERLPLLFGCCHPALSPDAQLALTLRAVCGLTTAQIARATLTPLSSIAQRIVRAKRKIGAAGIPLRIPAPAERPERLDLVLTVVSVMYSEAHLVAGRDAAADRDLADDAIWLARVIAAALPREAEAHGLVALLEFHRARESARAVDGELDTPRGAGPLRWDAALVRRRSGRARARRAAAASGRMAAACRDRGVPCRCRRPSTTDWLQVPTLYDLLLAYDRSPVVRLNRAVALGRIEGTEVALAEVDALEGQLARYHLWHAVRAQLLRESGA